MEKNSLFSKKGNWTFTSKEWGWISTSSYKKFTQGNFPGGSVVKNRLAMQGMWVPCLVKETKTPRLRAQLSLWAVTAKSVRLNFRPDAVK